MGAPGVLPRPRGRCISVGVRAARCAPWVAGLAGVVVLAAGPLRAQDSAAALRGSVVTTAGVPVAYALVRVFPVSVERFTDARGAFTVRILGAGPQRVEVRQVGYQPFDTTVTVGGAAVALRLVLRPLDIRLDELTVTAMDRCIAPGLPDLASEPQLAVIFAQVRENARRYALLADSYPFRYAIARTFADLDDGANVLWSVSDTLEYQSNTRVRYRPGDVVGWGPGPRGVRTRVVRLPSLPDFADSAFHANHCFAFLGLVTREGRRVARFAFRAAEALRTPDIDGEVDLDPVTYQVRYATVRLTRPSRVMPGLLSATDSVTFGQLFRNIVTPTEVRGAVVPTLGLRLRSRVARHVESQALFRVHFLRPLPTDSSPSP